MHRTTRLSGDRKARWPGWASRILANLKMLVETGDTLPDGQDTVRQDEKSLQP
jgi:hypothetical protein